MRFRLYYFGIRPDALGRLLDDQAQVGREERATAALRTARQRGQIGVPFPAIDSGERVERRFQRVPSFHLLRGRGGAAFDRAGPGALSAVDTPRVRWVHRTTEEMLCQSGRKWKGTSRSWEWQTVHLKQQFRLPDELPQSYKSGLMRLYHSHIIHCWTRASLNCNFVVS